ncbi:hypothetical protein ACFWHT_01475 [Microbacterium sp. NPDC058342]|uniref:hypothetical protein n=1 Tax=Microbacterium sp. NPDC058342 TaxID=3346454 RepID=UPI00365F4370
MTRGYEYMFRFCADPGFNDEEELRRLDAFVDAARIDDVMVFANVQEINTGHMSAQEQEAYIALVRAVEELVRDRGISTSVNQWHSIMHFDGGKRLRADQDFGLMVDVDGRSSTLCACPLDEAWREYLGGVYARYAALAPAQLWVEDDFRFHNHSPLRWGGCFCDRHLALYSERAGHEVTREDFLAGLLRPGAPHPYRSIWLDACRDVLIDVARGLEGAVRAAAPGPRLALMSSVPAVHAAEGRDWGALLGAFAGDGRRPALRVHLPSYVERTGPDYLMMFNQVSMHTTALLGREVDVYPELENFPYSRYSSSVRFTRFQLLSAQPLDPAGMTIDLYDLNGNGIVETEEYEPMLAEVKDYLLRTRAAGVFALPPGGVSVMTDQRSAWTLHTDAGEGLEELYPRETIFAGLLPALGIPFRFATDPVAAGDAVAISGQYLRNLTLASARELLSRPAVILDAEAAHTALDLGLGDAIGVSSVRRLDEDDVAYEQAVPGLRLIDREGARMSAMISAPPAAAIGYLPGARVESLTRLHSSDRRVVAEGAVVVDDRVLILPFGWVPAASDIPRMLLNPARAELVQGFLRSRASLPMLPGQPFVHPYAYGGDEWIYLVNASSDDSPRIVIDTSRDVQTVSVDASHEQGARRAAWHRDGDDRIVIDVALPSWEAVLVNLGTAPAPATPVL